MSVRWVPLLLLFALVGGCSAPAAQVGAVRIENSWSRPAAAGSNGAVYLTLKNGGEADRLTAASTEVARTVELHRTITEGGVARMVHVKDGIELPAGGTVELKPGGYHVMLIGLNRELRGGDKFSLTLTFQRAGSVSVMVEVKGSASDSPPAH